MFFVADASAISGKRACLPESIEKAYFATIYGVLA